MNMNKRIALKSPDLADVTLTTVKVSPYSHTLLVKVGQHEAGLVEKLFGCRGELHPWKAFRGVGDRCAYVTSFYPREGGIEAAVGCVLDRALKS